jgi:hypothetical protein
MFKESEIRQLRQSPLGVRALRRGTDLNPLKPSGFFYVRPGLTYKNSTWCSLCVQCFVWMSEQTAAFVLHIINRLFFITVVESVYSAVRNDSLYKANYVSSLNLLALEFYI